MGPQPPALLGLVFCLGQTIHAQWGAPPKPSIRAEPGPVISQGQPVTIVCRGPAGAVEFRLEKESGSSNTQDQKALSQCDSEWTEARFYIPTVSEDSPGYYYCLYHKGPNSAGWSDRSEILELKVTHEEVSTPPAGLAMEHIYILVPISVAILLCLLLLVLLLVHRQHQKKHGALRSTGEEQRPQERLTPTVVITESTADLATADTLPEENRDMDSPIPAAGDPQEVTYAQLDMRALTLREAPAQPLGTTADSSLYAAVTRC